MIADPTQTQFIDTGLSLDTMYAYRVYVVTPHGTYSAASSTAATMRTLNNPLPFADGFEDGLVSWNSGGDSGVSLWGISEDHSAEGLFSLASNPDTMYPQNSNTWIETAVDLRNTEWPVLSFQDRYGLNSGDWIRLEISATGGPSANVYSAYETSRPTGANNVSICRHGKGWAMSG